MAHFRHIERHIVLATANPMFRALRDLGAGLCPVVPSIEHDSSSSSVSIDYLCDASTSASAANAAPRAPRRKLHRLLDFVDSPAEAQARWRVFALQDVHYRMAYFAVDSIGWLRYALPHIPNTLFEVVRGADRPHRIFCDIDYDTPAPMPMQDQLRALGLFKALLRAGAHAAFGVERVVMSTAQASTDTKVSWHVIVRMYTGGREQLVRDTYHLLGFMQWLCAADQRAKFLPGLSGDHTTLLEAFCGAVDMVVYGATLRVFRCFGHTKAGRDLPLQVHPPAPLTEQLFADSLIVPVEAPDPEAIVAFHAPRYNRRKAALEPPARRRCTPVRTAVALEEGPGADAQPDAAFPRATLHAPPLWPPAAGMEFKLTPEEYARCGGAAAHIFALMVQRVHGRKYLPASGVVTEINNSDPARGVVHIAGGKYCACRTGEHRRATEPTYMVCMFAVQQGLPWYTQRCYDTADCGPVARYWLPLFVAELMAAAQRRSGELAEHPAYDMKALARAQEQAFLATLPSLLPSAAHTIMAASSGEEAIRLHVSAAKISMDATLTDARTHLDTMLAHHASPERILKGRIAVQLFEHLEKALHTLGMWRMHSSPEMNVVQCEALCVAMYTLEMFEGTSVCTISMEDLWTDLKDCGMWRALIAQGTAPAYLPVPVATLLRAYPQPATAAQVDALRDENAALALPEVPPDQPAAAGAWGAHEDADLMRRFKILKGGDEGV